MSEIKELKSPAELESRSRFEAKGVIIEARPQIRRI